MKRPIVIGAPLLLFVCIMLCLGQNTQTHHEASNRPTPIIEADVDGDGHPHFPPKETARMTVSGDCVLPENDDMTGTTKSKVLRSAHSKRPQKMIIST